MASIATVALFAGPALGADAEKLTDGESLAVYAVEDFGFGPEVTTYDVDTVGEAVVIAAALRDDGHLISVDLDAPVQSLAEPMRPTQWALDAMPFEATWSGATGAGVTVAIVDSGVYAAHEDLAGAVLPGLDLIDGTDGRIDPGGHGTLIAGVIGARLNGLGIAGAAPGVAILPVRVLDANGAGYMSKVSQGIIWAVDNGADVVTMSLGGTSPSSGVQAAMAYARSEGVPVFAAAGNHALSGNPVVYPAAYPEAIAVAAVDGFLGHAAYSSHHPYVDLAAPGSSILSTFNGGTGSYVTATGTSMATPYAAATAALLKARNPGITIDALESALVDHAVDLGSPGHDTYYGHGFVDVAASLSASTGSGAPAPAPPAPAPVTPTGDGGYWVVSADGAVRAYGHAGHYGDLSSTPSLASAPIVASAATPSGNGYWLAGRDGRVYAFGGAVHHGDTAAFAMNAAIVGIAATPSGNGYFLLGADGGIFTFGDATFQGSTGNLVLNAPVLDMTVTPSGHGYWLVGADGGIFSFGDAVFVGSTGNLALNQPVTSMTASDLGSGYWLVAADGGIFAFGVPFHGSLVGLGLPTATGARIRALPDGTGYYILTVDGGVYAFGTAPALGHAAPLAWITPAVDLMLAP